MFESNLNKILLFEDWEIKDNCKILILMINGKESELVVSYMSSYIVDKYIYYLMNIFIETMQIFDIINICLSNPLTSDIIYQRFGDYRWENI